MTLVLLEPDRPLMDFLISVAIFFITLGVATICVAKRTHTKLHKAVNDSTKTFCRNTEQLISKEI